MVITQSSADTQYKNDTKNHTKVMVIIITRQLIIHSRPGGAVVAFVSFFLFSTDYGPVSVTLNLVGHSDSLTYQTHIHCWPPESCPACTYQ